MSTPMIEEVDRDNIVIEITSLSGSEYGVETNYGTESELDWEEACNQEAHDEIDKSPCDNYCHRCCTVINSEITPSARVCTCISEGSFPHTEFCPDCDFSWSGQGSGPPCECILDILYDEWVERCNKEALDEVQNSDSYNYCNKCCSVIESSIEPPPPTCKCISEGRLPHTAYCDTCDVSWSHEDMDMACECYRRSIFDGIIMAIEPYLKKLDNLYANVIQNAWYKYDNSNQPQTIKQE